MKWKALVLVFMVVTACGEKQHDTFSFNEKDYEFKENHFSNNIKIGEDYVNKSDPRLTMKKLLSINGQVECVAFFYDSKPFGPRRFYDSKGNFVEENISFTGMDTTGFVYDKDNQILKKATKK